MHQNAFDADLSKVDVIFMWLFPELMRLLRPKILAQARPVRGCRRDVGSRFVATRCGRRPGRRAACDPQMDRACAHRRRLGLGSRPRRAPTAFQRAFRAAHAAGRRWRASAREILQNVILRGEALQFSLRMTVPGIGYTQIAFVGRVRDDTIEGYGGRGHSGARRRRGDGPRSRALARAAHERARLFRADRDEHFLSVDDWTGAFSIVAWRSLLRITAAIAALYPIHLSAAAESFFSAIAAAARVAVSPSELGARTKP